MIGFIIIADMGIIVAVDSYGTVLANVSNGVYGLYIPWTQGLNIKL
jgi:hypothetical protein